MRQLFCSFVRSLGALGLFVMGGCSAPSALLNLVGVATDTSASWEIVKFAHDKLTEGGPVPCFRLNSVEQALSSHCGVYVQGSLRKADIATSRLPLCPLAVAARSPQFWPVLAELIDKGAQPEACVLAPMVELAQAQACPDFAAATPAERQSLLWLATADARAVHHDVVRMLSCPQARAVGLDHVLERWVAEGALQPGAIGFSPLSALHPDMLGSPLSQQLEKIGHTARAGLDPYNGALRPGFEEAFRSSHWPALDWWFSRAPELANRVPPPQGAQLPWLPLAKVLVPDSLAQPSQQQAMVEYLLARGANPSRRLPQQPDMTVLRLAREMKSPMLPLLERASESASARERLARGSSTKTR